MAPEQIIIQRIQPPKPEGTNTGSPGGSITRRNMNLLALFFILCIGLLPRTVRGLECYECLSLSCPSGAICLSIKKTMTSIFVPKRHVIHFDPNDPCPEEEDPKNSTRWASLSRECLRSDSLCLVSPIEIVSTFEGSKGGKSLGSEFQLTTKGYLRGCASRRKLLENDPTIRVQVNLLSGPGGKSGDNKNSGNSENSQKTTQEMYKPSEDLELEMDLSKMKFDDDFHVKKVYSHIFFVDQWTSNSTRCYQDNCNTKIKYRSSATRDRVSILVYLAATFVYINFSLGSW